MKKIILVAAIFFAVMFTSTVFSYGNAVANDNNGGWVNVPLKDTQPFTMNCEYRVSLKDEPPQVYSTTVVTEHNLALATNGNGEFYALVVPDTKKNSCYYNGRFNNYITKIEKRCKLPDTAPSGMIGQFALAQCPDGWSTWLFAKATVECNTSNCKIAVCKKD
jgi:hypothetical protein